MIQSIVKIQQRKTRIVKLSMQDKDHSDSSMNLDVSDRKVLPMSSVAADTEGRVLDSLLILENGRKTSDRGQDAH